jgi:hypothetical protein
MKGSLILNPSNEIAFVYGEPLGFSPEWVSIDVEQEELYIGNEDDEGQGKQIQLDKIKQEIYDRILPDTQILLILVKDNDILKPVAAKWVPLMITQQI